MGLVLVDYRLNIGHLSERLASGAGLVSIPNVGHLVNLLFCHHVKSPVRGEQTDADAWGNKKQINKN